MKVDRKDLNKCGIYCIRNTVNNKVYIGKSKNIYVRIASHIQLLNNLSKDENRHLINSWYKHGCDKFEYFVLEYLELDENLLKERELYWIDVYDSTNRNKGYNLRRDSSTNMIVHEETRKLLSKSNSGENNPNYGNKWTDKMKSDLSKKIKDQFKNERVPSKEASLKGVKAKAELWKNHPELKEKMIKKVREKNTKYKIYQYDKKTNDLIKIWNNINDIIKENPTYKKHNIYAVCSGEKKSMYGYIWIKILNDEDIVQTNLKELE